MANNLAFTSFHSDRNQNIQYLTKIEHSSDILYFPKAVTETHSYRNVNGKQFLQTLIHGAIEFHDIDIPRNVHDAGDAYLNVFEKLSLQQIDELIAKVPSLENYIDALKLKDEGYLQQQILEHGGDISEELMANDTLLSASNFATYTLAIQGHSARVKQGEWVSPLDTQYHAEIKLNPKNTITSDYSHEFDEAAQQIFNEYVQDDLLVQSKSILEKQTSFKFTIVNN